MDEIVRQRVAATWAFRTRAEIEATARFTRMATELAEVGATPFVVRGVTNAAADEARHRDLSRLAAKWGEPDALNHVPPLMRIGRSDMDRRHRLLWEMVAVCCVSETMNTSLMTRCLEVVKDEEIRSTLHELLKDEVSSLQASTPSASTRRRAARGSKSARARRPSTDR